VEAFLESLILHHISAKKNKTILLSGIAEKDFIKNVLSTVHL
jgi:hypothetical protein